jgi:uncharacterized protein YecT (DUF1311 family)
VQAGVSASDPDPESVTQARDAQAKWLNDRDVACSGVGVGPLYAKTRAECYADQAGQRTRELREMLSEIPKE